VAAAAPPLAPAYAGGAVPAARGWRRPSIIPGFGLALGITVAWLSLVVLIPLAALFIRAGGLGPAGLWGVATDPRVLAALELSFGAALAASLANLVMGTLVAWALVRYDFPLKRVFDAVVDLPFALPTAVAGIALTSLYAGNGWIGQFLEPLGIRVAFTPLGVAVALTFVGLPFVVRTVQPVLQDLELEVEEAAATLGATRLQTITRVVLPAVLPALLTGAAMAFARAVGEYGSVIFIAGNLPYVSEIAPLLIIIRLEEFDYAGATAVGALMLVISFAVLLLINLVQAWTRHHAVKD
jgi:sulfate/thiosulfate transport system permease protein